MGWDKFLEQGDRFERREFELAMHDRPSASPPQPVIQAGIAAKGFWSGNNNLGIEVEFAPDENNRQTILNMPEWGPPEEWTISLYIKGFPDGTFDGFGLKAIINYGAGGSTQVVEIDWRQGARISLPMNSVNIIAEFTDLDVTDEGQGLRLGVQLARGSRATQSLPNTAILKITEETPFGGGVGTVGDLAQGLLIPAGGTGTNLMGIPNFASRIVVLPTGSEAEVDAFVSNDIYVAMSSGNTIGTSLIFRLNTTQLTQFGGGIPVVGGARYVNIFNNSAANIRVTAYAEIDG